MPWILRITDRVAINQREQYEDKARQVAAALKQILQRTGLPVRYMGSGRVAFGKDNYEYAHHVWFRNLGDFESPQLQRTEICRLIEEAYAEKLFMDSRWEFLEVMPTGEEDDEGGGSSS